MKITLIISILINITLFILWKKERIKNNHNYENNGFSGGI